MKKTTKFRTGRNAASAQGQSITESMLCMIILCLVLFGLLQVFQIAVAKLLTEYAAFRAARSYAVGFRDFLIHRSSRVAAIGASGKLIEPDNQNYGSPMSQFAFEQLMIPEYLQGNRWIEYEFWEGGNAYDSDFYNSEVSPPATTITPSYTETGSGTVRLDVVFNEYPFQLFDLMDKDRVWFDTSGKARDIRGTSEIANHAKDYLSEDAP